MIYLLYGSDTYSLKKRISDIKIAAGIDSEGLNFQEISTDFNASKIISEASAMPFLSEKRVLLLSGFLAAKDKSAFEQLNIWLPQTPVETELIFVEKDAPDQRLSLVKTLNKIAKVEVFGNHSPAEIMKMIDVMVVNNGGEITKDATQMLQLYVGGDLERMSQEILKLITFDKNISKENVDLLVDAGYFNTIFDLTDAISMRNQGKALRLLRKAVANGENEIFVLSMVSTQIRNLLLISDLKKHGLSDSEISTKARLHPFVTRKCLSMIRNFTIRDLTVLHRELLDIDIQAKTTSVDPSALLTSFIVKATSK